MKYKTAMLIDDDEDSNFVDNWIIEKFFAEKVIVMQSAVEALEYLKNRGNAIESPAVRISGEEELPEVIFLDIRLPILDGFGFLKEFENLPEVVRNKSKIIVLSSSFDKGDFDRAMSNKYVYGYLNKPLSLEAVEEL